MLAAARAVRRLLQRFQAITIFLLIGVGAVIFVLWLTDALAPPQLQPSFREPPWAFLGLPSNAEPALPSPQQQQEPNPPAASVVRFVHQTWSNADLPVRLAAMRSTWRQCFPQAQHILWTDADNRRLVRRHYPWFLHRYDALPAEIYRADAVRYLMLFHYGGIYADLDTECLSPFSHLLVNHSIVLGAMATGTSTVIQVLADGLVQNSFMYSRPRHPFWLEMVHYILAKPASDRAASPEDVTGPQALMYVMRDYRRRFPDQKDAIMVYPPRYFNPVSWLDLDPKGPCRDWGRMTDQELKLCRRSVQKTSYVVQYHFHTWTLTRTNP